MQICLIIPGADPNILEKGKEERSLAPSIPPPGHNNVVLIKDSNQYRTVCAHTVNVNRQALHAQAGATIVNS